MADDPAYRDERDELDRRLLHWLQDVGDFILESPRPTPYHIAAREEFRRAAGEWGEPSRSAPKLSTCPGTTALAGRRRRETTQSTANRAPHARATVDRCEGRGPDRELTKCRKRLMRRSWPGP